MNGYKIYYLDELGKSAFTWFGEPLMSDGFRWSFNKLDMVLLMFEMLIRVVKLSVLKNARWKNMKKDSYFFLPEFLFKWSFSDDYSRSIN